MKVLILENDTNLHKKKKKQSKALVISYSNSGDKVKGGGLYDDFNRTRKTVLVLSEIPSVAMFYIDHL